MAKGVYTPQRLIGINALNKKIYGTKKANSPGSGTNLTDSSDPAQIQPAALEDGIIGGSIVAGLDIKPLTREEQDSKDLSMSQNVQYCLQHGKPWNSVQDYHLSNEDTCLYNGTQSYKSLTNNNIGNQPDTSPTEWELIGEITKTVTSASEGTEALAETADNATVLSGIDDTNKYVNSLKLENKFQDKKASQVEVDARVDDEKFITSLKFDNSNATSIATGIGRNATAVEARDGSNNTVDDNVFVSNRNLEDELAVRLLTTIVVANQAEVVFDNLPLARYQDYRIDIANLESQNNGVSFEAQFSNNNGTTWNAGASDYRYNVHGRHDGGANIDDESAASNVIIFNATGGGKEYGNVNNFFGRLTLELSCLDTNDNKTFLGNFSYPTDTVGREAGVNFSGATNTNALPIDAIRFFFGTGNIVKGIFKIYGIK